MLSEAPVPPSTQKSIGTVHSQSSLVKKPRQQIFWRNVFFYLYFHAASIYALTQFPPHWYTVLLSKFIFYSFLLTIVYKILISQLLLSPFTQVALESRHRAVCSASAGLNPDLLQTFYQYDYLSCMVEFAALICPLVPCIVKKPKEELAE